MASAVSRLRWQDELHGLIGSVCGDDIDGGVAVVGTTVYLPCTSGIIAVRASQVHRPR